jgi:tRNA pseudouridine38-40 synthase
VSRFKLTIEYVGTRYRGWQIQKNARTVQGALKEAVQLATQQREFELYGAGRTDAGVHALSQAAHLDIDTRLSAQELSRAINDRLPVDINVLNVEAVSRRFHARHGATGRRYLYQISRRRTAFAKPFVWWVRDALAIDAMCRAAQSIVGRHDFSSFRERDDEDSSSLVVIDAVTLAEVGDLILLRIQGSHFLWKMVRRIVGVLVEVGRGHLPPDSLSKLLLSHSPLPAQFTAPPAGLFLERVLYEGERADEPLRPACFSLQTNL